jgi:hypothetical protein
MGQIPSRGSTKPRHTPNSPKSVTGRAHSILTECQLQ